MTELNQVYKCNVCGNIVEVLHAGVGELVCCGKPMELLKEKAEEEGNEKHKPVIEKVENITKAKVGSVAHPMEENHFIEWIEVIAGDMVHRKFLKAGDVPEADFEIVENITSVRAYCNVHGLWKA